MEKQSTEFFAFNTVNSVMGFSDEGSALDGVQPLCERYERLFSRTLPESGLSAINSAGGKPVDVDPELAGFIDASLLYCKAAGGLFDITMGVVTRLWDFHRGIIPGKDAVDAALSHVGWERVHVDGCTVVLEDPDASLDLGGIAKGYIADRILEHLKACGIENACVNLGGNVAVMGGKPDGTPWEVGLRMPVQSDGQDMPGAFAAASLRDGSVVTSGIYERAFEQDGILYHHILDPKTGYPAKTDLLGASLVANSSLDADGYSTALIIMGLQNALKFVNARPELEAVFVAADGRVVATSGIGSSIPFRMA